MPSSDIKKHKKKKTIKHPETGIGLAWDRIGGAWKVEILWQLRSGPLRFGEIKSRIPAISDRMLSLSLKELETASLLHREIFAEIPPRVIYTLTPEAGELIPILQKLNSWGLKKIATKPHEQIEGGHDEEKIEWA